MNFKLGKKLIIDISPKRIILVTIKGDKISNYKLFDIPPGTIVNNKVLEYKFISETINDYIQNKFFVKSILILNIDAIIRISSYPVVNKNQLKNVIQYSLQEKLPPVNLSKYTTDYRILSYDNEIKAMLVAVETDILESYIIACGKAKLHIIELAHNFFYNYFSSLDKNNIVIINIQNDSLYIQFLNNGILNSITKCNYTDLDRVFSPFITVEGDVLIKKAYVPISADTTMIKYLENKNIEIIIVNEIYDDFTPTKSIKTWF